MGHICQLVGNFLKREDGPTAVEYAVMLTLIIVVCLAAITTLGSNAGATFTTVGNDLAGSLSDADSTAKTGAAMAS